MASHKDGRKSAEDASSASKCPFLSEFDSLKDTSDKGLTQPGTEHVKTRAALLMQWLHDKPAELFAELRANRPVLFTGGPVPTTVVTKAVDVKEVLRNNEAFPVIPYQHPININPPPAGLGHFLLADLDLARHDREKEVFRQAMPNGYAHRRGIRAHAEDLVAIVEKRGGAEIDVVKDMAERLPIRVFDTYFGVPTGGEDQMPERELFLVVTGLFQALFIDLGRDPAVQSSAQASFVRFRTYVESLVQIRKAQVLASADVPADVLGKFIWFQGRPESPYRDVFSSEERVVSNLCGIMIGGVAGFVQALANIVDVLSAKDVSLWNGAVSAAQADDVDKLWRYAQEAFRFRPQSFGILRATGAPATLRNVPVPGKNIVLASHQSAMMDEDFVPEPDRFKLDRPDECYLHFGFARNKCLAIDLAPVVITEGLRAILRLKNVRRAAGSKLKMGTPYPASLVLSYDV